MLNEILRLPTDFQVKYKDRCNNCQKQVLEETITYRLNIKITTRYSNNNEPIKIISLFFEPDNYYHSLLNKPKIIYSYPISNQICFIKEMIDDLLKKIEELKLK